jgi:NADP-dependent 3-hydroxy acid dehydrogenase YdfG
MSKVLLITGASRGIGRACVIRALEHTNARVFAIARSKDALEELAQQYKDRMAYLDDDLTKEDVCTEAIQQCIAKFDRLDAIICSAG